MHFAQNRAIFFDFYLFYKKNFSRRIFIHKTTILVVLNCEKTACVCRSLTGCGGAGVQKWEEPEKVCFRFGFCAMLQKENGGRRFLRFLVLLWIVRSADRRGIPSKNRRKKNSADFNQRSNKKEDKKGMTFHMQ